MGWFSGKYLFGYWTGWKLLKSIYLFFSFSAWCKHYEFFNFHAQHPTSTPHSSRSLHVHCFCSHNTFERYENARDSFSIHFRQNYYTLSKLRTPSCLSLFLSLPRQWFVTFRFAAHFYLPHTYCINVTVQIFFLLIF